MLTIKFKHVNHPKILNKKKYLMLISLKQLLLEKKMVGLSRHKEDKEIQHHPKEVEEAVSTRQYFQMTKCNLLAILM